MRVVGTIMGFILIVMVTILRVALGAVLAIVTPIIMPLLALLSAAGLVITIAFACVGHWHDALNGAVACAICGVAFTVIAGVTQLVNPLAFSAPVSPIAASNHRRS